LFIFDIFALFYYLWLKICFFCGSKSTVKNGFSGSVQRYLCKSCGKRFIPRKSLDLLVLFADYLFGKQTISQLGQRYNISSSTIRRKLDTVSVPTIISAVQDVVILMDTTYFGLGFGVVVFKDSRTKSILWHKFVRNETVVDYAEGVDFLVSQGIQIDGIVCDGLRGMFKQFSSYRVQMCQYHQLRIVQRYLTKNPELPASIELLTITNLLTKTDKESFIGAFYAWCERWDIFLKQRGTDKRTGKSYFVHKRLRSAYLSLKRNMPYLWTWYDYIQLGIPNTNNALEGMFNDLKNKLRNHPGLKKRKKNEGN
jgi:hypothetical protein